MNESVIKEFSQLGCKDKSIIVAAAHVYLELCEVKKYHNITYKYDKELDVICLTGSRTKSQPLTLFVPVPTSRTLTFEKLQSFATLNKEEQQSVCIALVDPDTTCIYYQIQDGLVLPNKEEDGKKCDKIDVHIRKHRKVIEEGAMCGIPITIPNKINKVTNSLGKDI